jgi:molybdopterin-guanine dinucleotide biosynthesis protein MobB
MFTSRMEKGRLAPFMASTPSFVTIAGLKKSGKTTVAEALIGELVRRGLRVASVKSMLHGEFRLEPEGTDTRRHLAAGAEAALAFSAEEDAVFARRSAAGQRERMKHWLPSGVDWVVCEGHLPDVRADRVIVCLAKVRDFAETLAVRGLEVCVVVAASGVAAGAAVAGAAAAAAAGAATAGAAAAGAAVAGAAAGAATAGAATAGAAAAGAAALSGASAGQLAEPLPVPLLDARDPRDLAKLVDLVLAGRPGAGVRSGP